MRTLPKGSVDPIFGRRVSTRRLFYSLQYTWNYGYSINISVRYWLDVFSSCGLLLPVDA